YQAIDFAIHRRLAVVEAGAQGEHKLARGYLPQTTFSAHYIADPGLRRAINDYLKRERAYVAEAGRELLDYGPFRKDAAEAPGPASPFPKSPGRTLKEPPCPPTTRTTSLQRSCAASFPATRFTRTSTRSPSSTSCRARRGTRWCFPKHLPATSST